MFATYYDLSLWVQELQQSPLLSLEEENRQSFPIHGKWDETYIKLRGR